jgi:phage recombination protein Bet
MNAELRTTTPMGLTGFTRDSVDLLKTTICKGSTDDELKLFVQVCQRTGLDPFARQIFAVHRKDNKTGKMVMSIQTSIDGFRLIAERSKNYAGQRGPFWTADGEHWKEVWLAKDAPAAAKVGIMRRGFSEPLWAVATWEEFCPTYNGQPMGLWRKLGPLMLAKCAESQGLRRAFPQDLSGIYTEEEMAQAVEAVEAETVPEVVEWTDDERQEARLQMADLADALMEAGCDEDEIKDIMAKPTATIGTTDTFDRWANRLLGYRDRVMAKHKPAPKANSEEVANLAETYAKNPA